MNLSIVLLDGEKLNFKIDKESCTIGRSPQCDVVIQHEAMSRKHCLLEIKNGNLFVTDLGSSNGVSIEGEKIPPNTPVPYQTFLSLAFGAVQSISIDLEEAKEEKPHSELSSPSINQRKMEKARPKLDKTNPGKAVPQSSKEDQKSKMIKVAAVIAILGVLGYFMTKEETPDQPTPEQIYE
jgi:pSer/pThr/pTyr-binding forkhead associated (FHA) protein